MSIELNELDTEQRNDTKKKREYLYILFKKKKEEYFCCFSFLIAITFYTIEYKVKYIKSERRIIWMEIHATYFSYPIIGH